MDKTKDNVNDIKANVNKVKNIVNKLINKVKEPNNILEGMNMVNLLCNTQDENHLTRTTCTLALKVIM